MGMFGSFDDHQQDDDSTCEPGSIFQSATSHWLEDIRQMSHLEMLENADLQKESEAAAGQETPGDSSANNSSKFLSGDPNSFMSSQASVEEHHVVLHFEALTDTHAKALMAWTRFGCLGALASLIVLLILKASKVYVAYRPSRHNLPIANLVIGGACFIMLSLCCIKMMVQWCRVSTQGGYWQPRRRRIFLYALAVLIVQWLSCALYIASNAVAIAPCLVLKEYEVSIVLFALQTTMLNTVVALYLFQAANYKPVRFTAWFWVMAAVMRTKAWLCCAKERREDPEQATCNKQKHETFVIDSSPWYHVTRVLLWCAVEAVIIVSVVQLSGRADDVVSLGDDSIVATCELSQRLYPYYNNPDAYECPALAQAPDAVKEGRNDPAMLWQQWNAWNMYVQGMGGKASPNDEYVCQDMSYINIVCDDTRVTQTQAFQQQVILLWTRLSLTEVALSTGMWNVSLPASCNGTLANVTALIEEGGVRAAWGWAAGNATGYHELVIGIDQQILESYGADENATLAGQPQVLADVLRSGLFVRVSLFKSASLTAIIVLLAVDWVLYVTYMCVATTAVSKLPYIPLRRENVLLRWEFRSTFGLFFVINLSWVLLWFVNYGSDAAGTAWMGMLGVWMPLQISGSFIAVELCFLYWPEVKGHLSNPMQESLQRILWREKPSRQQRLRMNHAAKHLGGQVPKEQPLFCFERAIKSLHWSAMAYSCFDPDDTSHLTEKGMRIGDFRELRKVHHADLDAAAVMAWGDSGAVISFRGTKSMRNALTDVKVWMNSVGMDMLGLEKVERPEGTGCFKWKMQRNNNVGVHAGFWRSWEALKTEILTTITDIITSLPASTPMFSFTLTGHSLGGALAVVAGPQIYNHIETERMRLGLSTMLTLSCYTFGSPRVGNQKFGRVCNECIPDTWHIINDQDMVPRLDPFTKFLIPYKRTGQQVIVNRRGDMIVRPGFAERSLWTVPIITSRNVKHHFLRGSKNSYAASLGAVIQAQLRGDGDDHGKAGMLSVLRSNFVLEEVIRSMMVAKSVTMSVVSEVTEDFTEEKTDDGTVADSLGNGAA